MTNYFLTRPKSAPPGSPVDSKQFPYAQAEYRHRVYIDGVNTEGLVLFRCYNLRDRSWRELWFDVAVAPCGHVKLLTTIDKPAAREPGELWRRWEHCAVCSPNSEDSREQRAREFHNLGYEPDPDLEDDDVIEEDKRRLEEHFLKDRLQRENLYASQFSMYELPALEPVKDDRLNIMALTNRGQFAAEVKMFAAYWQEHEAHSEEETTLLRVKLLSYLQNLLVEKTDANFWLGHKMLPWERSKDAKDSKLNAFARQGKGWLQKRATFDLDIALKLGLIEMMKLRWDHFPGWFNWAQLKEVPLTRMLAAVRLHKKWCARSREEEELDKKGVEEINKIVANPRTSDVIQQRILESPSLWIWRWQDQFLWDE